MTEQRQYWIDTLARIIDAPLKSGAAGELKKRMPVQDRAKWDAARKDNYACLEAAGRTLCGAAPWLDRPCGDPSEESLRQKYAELSRKTIDGITDPGSPDRAPFHVPAEQNGGNPFCQSLVDTAFLSHAILRGRTELYDKLPPRVKQNLKEALIESRKNRPIRNNWMLFSGMVEAALYVMGEEPDLMRVDACLYQHEQWYKGDGVYGDGPSFHWDYYNSYVIQPMFVDIARTFKDFFPEGNCGENRLELAIKREKRYAAILERMISPDGSFPVVGRSVTYRTAAFQTLAQAALQDTLPEGLTKPQVRTALTSVIHRCFDGRDNFDENGWLRTGICGYQPGLAEKYICTGSLYLCTTGFLPLGLDAGDPFWSAPDEPCTSQKIWSGADMPADHSI